MEPISVAFYFVECVLIPAYLVWAAVMIYRIRKG